jgi:hypothetical protein
MYSFLHTLQEKSHLCIPFLGIARSLSPNFHIHVSVSDLNIPSIFPCSRIGRPILEIYKPLTKYECRNWKTEHYNSVLEIIVSFLGIQYINGNQTLILHSNRPFICSAGSDNQKLCLFKVLSFYQFPNAKKGPVYF